MLTDWRQCRCMCTCTCMLRLTSIICTYVPVTAYTTTHVQYSMFVQTTTKKQSESRSKSETYCPDFFFFFLGVTWFLDPPIQYMVCTTTHMPTWAPRVTAHSTSSEPSCTWQGNTTTSWYHASPPRQNTLCSCTEHRRGRKGEVHYKERERQQTWKRGSACAMQLTDS